MEPQKMQVLRGRLTLIDEPGKMDPMFGPLGIPEILFIFALALLIFGPRKLPEIGRTLGKGMAEFRKASSELKRTIDTEMMQEEIRQSDPRRILRDTPDKKGSKQEPAPERPAGEVARGEFEPDATGSDATGSDAGSTTSETSAAAAAEAATDPRAQ